MSTMDDHREIEAFDDYTSKMGVGVSHKIRSHRAYRVPSAFPIRRILMGLTLLTMAAALMNSSTATHRPARTEAATAPIAIVEPQVIPPVASTTPRIDTGSEVDTEPRTDSRAGRSADVRKELPPTVEKAIAYALAQVGDRYKWGAAGPNAFDCSGLVLMAFKQIGISLPHYTGTMIGHGKKISRNQMQRGDIIFPTSGHVAIYLGNGQQIAASSGKGRIVVQPVYGFYAARRLV